MWSFERCAMDPELIKIIKKDIERCKVHTEAKGSEQLFQALLAKYNSVFPGFADDIPQSGKAAIPGSAFDFRPELNAVCEKLEMQLLIANKGAPLYGFKTMYADDLARLERVVNDTAGILHENEKQKLYKEVTAKYYPYIPKLGDGLYEFKAELGFFDDVTGSSLDRNLTQIYYKMIAYQSLGFPGLTDRMKSAGPVINLTTKNENHNTNENSNTVSLSFDNVRAKIDGMTSLPYEEMEEIHAKIDALEEIVKSKDGKSKKWSRAKDIIRWVADKGVDVGIAILPLLLKIN